jgi:hypothetical protein
MSDQVVEERKAAKRRGRGYALTYIEPLPTAWCADGGLHVKDVLAVELASQRGAFSHTLTYHMMMTATEAEQGRRGTRETAEGAGEGKGKGYA